MSSNTDPHAETEFAAVSLPHVVALEAEESRFVEGSDRLVQLSPVQPQDTADSEAAIIVEMSPDVPQKGNLRKAA